MVCSYTTSFSACFCLPEQDQCWSGWSVCKDFSLIWLNFLACLEVEWSMDSLWVKQTEAFLLVSTTYIHTSCLHTFFLHTFTNTHAFFLHTFANTHAISFSDFSFLKLHSALSASLWLLITGHFCVPRPDKISCLNFNVG